MNSGKSCAVLGVGGFATEVIEAAGLAGWNVAGLYDDNSAFYGRVLMGSKCVGTISDFEKGPPALYLIAIGSNEVRQRLAQRLEQSGHKGAVLIHPTACVSCEAVLGEGVYVGAGAFVGPRAKLGRQALVNVGTSIGHDAVLGDWTQVCPGGRVSGFGVLEEGAFMGSNAVLGPGATMGAWSKLGVASFAHRAVPTRTLAIGVPARIVSE